MNGSFDFQFHTRPPAQPNLRPVGMQGKVEDNMDWKRKRLLKRALTLLSVGILALMVAATDSSV